MRLTPRGEETAVLTETLERTDFKTPEDMAKQLLKDSAGVLSMRDAYVVVARVSPKRVQLWGPYYTEADAEKAAGRIPALAIGVSRLGSPGKLDGFWDGVEWPGFCVCGHAKEEHLGYAPREACGHSKTGDCFCKKFQEYAVKKKKKAPRSKPKRVAA